MSSPNNTPTATLDTSSNRYTIIFMIVLSFICALILSVLASALKGPQEIAKELDRNKQMLIAAGIMSPFDYFQVENEKGEFEPAKYSKGGLLQPSESKVTPTRDQILEIFKLRIHPFLVDDKGNTTTFEKAGIDEEKYTSEYRTVGYYKQPWKLIYKIHPNLKENSEKEDAISGYVIPINGMGLWDAIYGYLAIKPDGDTVIGISWYDQKETPGLGAVISEPGWQSQFNGKKIFQESLDGKTDFQTAPLGLTVIKGKVSEVLGNTPKALSSIDGIAGSTLTGNGVTNAYKDVLAAYRPFLISAHKEEISAHKEETKK